MSNNSHENINDSYYTKTQIDSLLKVVNQNKTNNLMVLDSIGNYVHNKSN